MTLESGLGHRTVPLLLAESSFNGSAKNWSSLPQLRADMTLEVRTQPGFRPDPETRVIYSRLLTLVWVFFLTLVLAEEYLRTLFMCSSYHRRC